MRPSYPSLCSISIFFRKRDKLSCSTSAIINLSMVSIVDSLLSMLHASANRILHCEANTQFIGSGYASSLSFFFLGCLPHFSATQHSHRRACTPLTKSEEKERLLTVYYIQQQINWMFRKKLRQVSRNYRNVADLTSGIPRWS